MQVFRATRVADPVAEDRRAGVRRSHLVVPSLALLACAIALVSHGRQLSSALSGMSVAIFAVTVVLHLAGLLVRSEAWRVVLSAVNRRAIERPALHLACAGTYLAGSFESHLGLVVRIALLRRLAPASAPPIVEMALADIPVFGCEAIVASLALVVAAPAVGLPWESVAIAPVVVAGLMYLAASAHGRYPENRLLRGLAVLGDPHLRARLACLVGAMSALMLLRTWLVLGALGLPHTYPATALVFVAFGVIGLLPIGPAAGPSAALVALGAGHNAATVAAAGLAVTSGSLLAVLLYGSVWSSIYLGRDRSGRVRWPIVRLPARHVIEPVYQEVAEVA